MPPEVETVYCQYCRKALTVKEEIEQNFHNVCHLEISNYEDNKESQYWYYLDAINATFDDISCDKDGNIIAIDLSRKGMTYLPDINNIDIFSHLEELNLSLNYLTRVPDWLYELPKLKRIIFPGNGFSHSCF